MSYPEEKKRLDDPGDRGRFLIGVLYNGSSEAMLLVFKELSQKSLGSISSSLTT